ncbi:F-box protein [Corchorus olitorius]|uniref:F-box protein n=1 Tax=Corchorus olitorius TaxID=93759 RepID=A0A1R3JA98_9ROSI|nr:F-box protein [Corchorus olitorius]
MVLRLNPLRVKVVRVFESYNYEENQDLQDYDYEYENSRYKYEIFDSETWEWKPQKDLLSPFSESLLPKQMGAILAYGGLHWLTMSGKNMLSFFEDKQSWELVPLPETETEDALFSSVRTRLTKDEGKLGVIYEKSHRKGIEMVELWIMKQDCDGKRLWSKKHELNFEACNEQIRDCSVLSFYNPDVVLMTGFGFVIFYNFKTGRFERVELDFRYNYAEDAVFVQTDVEPIHLKVKAEEATNKNNSLGTC